MIFNGRPESTRLLLLESRETIAGKAPDAALRMADLGVEGRHAIIGYRRGRYYVTALKTEAGTFLNNRRVRRSRRLTHGDNLSFGPVTYRFIDPDWWIRRRNRRIIRGIIAVAALAAGLVVHLKNYDRGIIEAAKEIEEPLPTPSAPIPTAGAAQIAKGPPAVSTPVAPVATRSAAAPVAVATAPSAKSTASAPLALGSPSPAASSDDTWSSALNRFRAMAGLKPVSEEAGLTASVDAHARYLLVNFFEGIRDGSPLGSKAYEEEKSRDGYSANGAEAAPNSQIAWGCGDLSVKEQIDRWIAGPFHRFAMLNPNLNRGGFAEASRDGCWAAALRLPPPNERVGAYERPVEFPPEGSSISLAYGGGEFPNPAASCPDYPQATGLPITLQIGHVMEVKVGADSLTEDGTPIEHCTYTAQTYHNSNHDAQEYARWALRNNGAVVMVPRAPLRPGSRYTVAIEANGKIYSWQFQAAN